MPLLLHTKTHLDEIQSEFNREFPGLKLSFIFDGDEKLNFSMPLQHSFSYAPVEYISPGCVPGDLLIDETMTIREVELLFETSWHLPAQVFAAIDGYWQKNSKTGSSRLKEYISPAVKTNKEDVSVFRG